MRRSQAALAAFVAVLALGLTVAAEAQPAGRGPGTLQGDLAKTSGQKEAVVASILKAVGPTLKAHLSAGRQVEVPGVGVFRVVRIDAHKDLIGGIPGIVPARSYVDFVPAAELNAAANAPGAVPARTIPGYQFRVNPSSAASSRIEGPKTPRGRASRSIGVGD
jgi:nucleoid DNA-binding protein